jgi:hypothetical protein
MWFIWKCHQWCRSMYHYLAAYPGIRLICYGATQHSKDYLLASICDSPPLYNRGDTKFLHLGIAPQTEDNLQVMDVNTIYSSSFKLEYFFMLNTFHGTWCVLTHTVGRFLTLCFYFLSFDEIAHCISAGKYCHCMITRSSLAWSGIYIPLGLKKT